MTGLRRAQQKSAFPHCRDRRMPSRWRMERGRPRMGKLGMITAALIGGLAAASPDDASAQGIGIDLYMNLVNREPKVMPATERIFYGKDLTQFGDLRIPKGAGPFPVAIVVHGGAWGSAVALHYTVAAGGGADLRGLCDLELRISTDRRRRRLAADLSGCRRGRRLRARTRQALSARPEQRRGDRAFLGRAYRAVARGAKKARAGRELYRGERRCR